MAHLIVPLDNAYGGGKSCCTNGITDITEEPTGDTMDTIVITGNVYQLDSELISGQAGAFGFRICCEATLKIDVQWSEPPSGTPDSSFVWRDETFTAFYSVDTYADSWTDGQTDTHTEGPLTAGKCGKLITCEWFGGGWSFTITVT